MAQVVELGAEIRQVVVVGDTVIETSDLGVICGPMKSHLCLSGFDGESRIPGASIGTVESTAQRVGVAEGSVDGPRAGNAEYQFMRTDSWKQPGLGQQPIVGGAGELGEVVEVGIVVGNS